MASLQWIYVLAGLIVFGPVAQTSSSVIPQKRDESSPDTSLKPNSWIIQAPKRPLLASGIGLPPAGMLLMTMDPNATMVNQQQQPLQLESSSTTSVPPTSAVVTSEAPMTEASVSSSIPSVSPDLAEDVFTNPSVDDLAVTETLSTSTVGTEAVTETSSSSTREPEIIMEDSNSETESSTDLVTEIPDDLDSTSDHLTDQTTDGEVIETTTDPWPSTMEWEETTTEINLETTTVDHGPFLACEGCYPTYHPFIHFEQVTTTESSITTETSGDVTDSESGSTENTTESGTGSDESTETVSDHHHMSAALISFDEPNFDAGSGVDPGDGSDAPPDSIPSSQSDPVVDEDSQNPATDSNIPLTEPAAAAANLLVFTTEIIPEDPGLGETTTIAVKVDDKDAPAVAAENKKLPTKNSRHLLSLDAKETNAKKGTEEEAVKSGEEIEETRQYRPYPIRKRMRPDHRQPIHRFDQNFRPEFEDYEDSNVIYRTYDYCYTLWCKFKTQLSRIGLL